MRQTRDGWGGGGRGSSRGWGWERSLTSLDLRRQEALREYLYRKYRTMRDKRGTHKGGGGGRERARERSLMSSYSRHH